MKVRIIETRDGEFFPQFKPGLFRSWRFLQKDADTSGWMLQRNMETRYAADAARFLTEESARAFIARVLEKARTYYRRQSVARAGPTVVARRVIKVEDKCSCKGDGV